MCLCFSDTKAGCITLRGKKIQVEKMQRSVEAILEKCDKDGSSAEHVKKEQGSKAYLRQLGTEETVRYPSYWKCVQKGTVDGSVKRRPIDPQSPAYKEIESLVQRTWEPNKVGHGNDAVGLHHSGVVVKKIWSLENPVLFREFDAKKKAICLSAAGNPCPSVKGLRGEHAILTHDHGIYCKITMFETSKQQLNQQSNSSEVITKK